jgi:hypothetical protein
MPGWMCKTSCRQDVVFLPLLDYLSSLILKRQFQTNLPYFDVLINPDLFTHAVYYSCHTPVAQWVGPLSRIRSTNDTQDIHLSSNCVVEASCIWGKTDPILSKG